MGSDDVRIYKLAKRVQLIFLIRAFCTPDDVPHAGRLTGGTSGVFPGLKSVSPRMIIVKGSNFFINLYFHI